jgi:hypothetical protein
VSYLWDLIISKGNKNKMGVVMINRTGEYWKKEGDDITARLVVWGGLLAFTLFVFIPWLIGMGKYVEWIFF